MINEIRLYNTWHPVIVGDGPKELQPVGPYENLWHLMSKIVLLKLVQIQKVRMFFNHETGCHVLLIEELPPANEAWKKHPAPSGYTPAPTSNTITVVCAVQEHTTYFGAYIKSDGEKTIPNWLISLVVSWIFPEMIRRLLRAGARALKADGPHYPLIEADKQGIYAETQRLVDAGVRKAQQDESSVRYGPQTMPPIDAVTKRARSLLQVGAAPVEATTM